MDEFTEKRFESAIGGTLPGEVNDNTALGIGKITVGNQELDIDMESPGLTPLQKAQISGGGYSDRSPADKAYPENFKKPEPDTVHDIITGPRRIETTKNEKEISPERLSLVKAIGNKANQIFSIAKEIVKKGLPLTLVAILLVSCGENKGPIEEYPHIDADSIKIINGEPNIRSEPFKGDDRYDSNSYGRLPDGTEIEINIKDKPLLQKGKVNNNRGYEDVWYGVPVESLEGYDDISNNINKDKDGYAWINGKYVKVNKPEAE